MTARYDSRYDGYGVRIRYHPSFDQSYAQLVIISPEGWWTTAPFNPARAANRQPFTAWVRAELDEFHLACLNRAQVAASRR